jgi:hypothetical protein
MNDQITKKTKELKKQYARTFHNDGLLDFFVGWALVSVGIFLLTSLTIFSFAGWMPILLIAPLKQRFVYPRFGYAKFSHSASIPRPILIGAGAVIVTGSLLITILGNEGSNIPIIVGMLGLSLLFVLDKGYVQGEYRVPCVVSIVFVEFVNGPFQDMRSSQPAFEGKHRCEPG